MKDQSLFLNIAIEIETGLNSKELLKVFQDVEMEVSREQPFKWDCRVIDHDILLYDDINLA
jgi:2-amino-4-hydroxy-6-hydroxymethyldihydropteridine diphosphokinase